MIRMVDIKSYDSPVPNFGNETEAFFKRSQNSRREICSRQFALGKSGKKIVFSWPAPFRRKSENLGN